MVYGNTSGVKQIVLDELDSLLGMYDKKIFIEEEVFEVITRHSANLNREICVFISRGGELLAVGIGDATTVPLADIRIKRDRRRFNGIRCIHTHPNGTSRLSNLDISALKNNRYDCMCAISLINGKPQEMSVGFIVGKEVEIDRFDVDAINDDFLFKKIKDSEIFSLDTEDLNKVEGERALLINVSDDRDVSLSLDELERLANTADIKVIQRIHQNRKQPDREFFVGQGKLKEIAMICQLERINLLIFDNQINASQFHHLEQYLKIPVLDRSMLILEIFSKHATTNEGKLQVELAKMKYNLPKLLGKGIGLSRQGGGMKTRGSGEKKLETDRRKIRQHIKNLSDKIDKLSKQRELRRNQRKRSYIKTITIVGYTNAGKSSLMNRLTKANVAVEDKLFKTLDSVTRHINYNSHEYLLTDTVGFISRLPHEFIDAFKSTLEEVHNADILLHVVDSSSEDLMRQYDIVLDVLSSLKANAPIITVYNKIDRAVDFLPPKLQNSVNISAKTGEGIKELMDLIDENIK